MTRSSLARYTLFAIIITYYTATTCSGSARRFKVYWNIPSFMCQKFNLPSVNVTEKYGIHQNENDAFRGSAVSILYDPGKFPALLENSTSGTLVKRNGGVPQGGSLSDHMAVFRQHVNELMPDTRNDGLAIIDFESWRPVYRQNFGTLQPYKDLSVQIEKQKHPRWPQRRLEYQASNSFEEAARTFMERSLATAKSMRPRAKWGYYGLPYCFNGRGDNIEDCSFEIQRENDGTKWLYDASDVIYPSVYMSEQIKPEDRASMVRGRVREAVRLAQRTRGTDNARVIAYHRYVFTDTRKFVNEKDTFDVINAIKSMGGDGVVLWGSSFDLNSRKKCVQFYEYLENTLGPVVSSFHPRFSVEEIKLSGE